MSRTLLSTDYIATRPGDHQRASHSYLCQCDRCAPSHHAIICACDRPGPTDDDRCTKCGRSARP
jgi:hypothetical protein